MSFESDVTRFAVSLTDTGKRLLPAIAVEVLRSIQEGSELTGAPGQPVGQYGPGYNPGQVGGELLASYQLTLPAPDVAAILTKSQHAVQNEDGVSASGGPYVQRSTVGGRHSVALTRVHFDRIVEFVVNGASRPEGFTPNALPAQ